MDIKQIQNRIVNFHKKRLQDKNLEATPELSLIHLTEELGEVARQIVNKKVRPDLFNEENLKEEIVDVILDSLILAHNCNVDLEKEINQKIEKLFKRHKFNE